MDAARPPDAGAATTAVYLFFVYELVSLFGSVVVGPYEALLPEIAPGSPARLRLEAIKVHLGILGTAIGLVGSDLLVHHVAVVGRHSRLTSCILLTVAIAVAIVFVPFFSRLAARTSKRNAYRLSMLAATVAFPLLAVAGTVPGIPDTVEIVVVAILVGAPIGEHFLVPVPRTADVIDYDSAWTRERREATYLGALSFVERTATSLAPLVIALLRLLGDTRGHTLGVRLAGPVGGLLILGALLFRSYDVPDDVPGRIEPEPYP